MADFNFSTKGSLWITSIRFLPAPNQGLAIVSLTIVWQTVGGKLSVAFVRVRMVEGLHMGLWCWGFSLYLESGMQPFTNNCILEVGVVSVQHIGGIG